jgi:hypothetical protein
MDALPMQACDERRDVRASIDAVVKEIYDALLSAFESNDEEARRHE